VKTQQTKLEEAEARQSVYDALTSEQKLKLLGSRRGKSKRERKRIMEGTK